MVWLRKQQLILGLLVVSLVVNLALVGYLAASGGLRRILLRLDLVRAAPSRHTFQIEDEERFRLLPDTSAGIAFVGDSLIAEGPWSEFFSEIHNRGIGGDRTDGVLGRLGVVLKDQPRQIFLLIGSNDLSSLVPIPQIVRNYRAILATIVRDSPATKVVVLGSLPINPEFAGGRLYSNKDVKTLNAALAKLVAEFPAIRFVDLAPCLMDSRGNLIAEYSKDGLHMNIKGYLALKDSLSGLLDQP